MGPELLHRKPAMITPQAPNTCTTHTHTHTAHCTHEKAPCNPLTTPRRQPTRPSHFSMRFPFAQVTINVLCINFIWEYRFYARAIRSKNTKNKNGNGHNPN
mmetsp:Transcript_22453/g.45073  ORF Transcript_22453/g.45073 Transcript_22453/m.45073 type:complete len:101 (-) Transcript_22453:1055-1357(-)